jgi:adenosylhomocysteine nucleosidase
MIGYVTGLASEADCLAALVNASRLRIAGIGAGRADRCARELVALGCSRLVSFGLAGGLAADMAPGSVVIAESVVTPDGYAYPAEASFTARLLAALPNAVRRTIAGSDTILATAAEKALLHQRTKGAAVDMESHQIARVAHEAGIGFVAVRAIADPFDAAFPRIALDAVGTDGKPDIARVLAGLARHPRELAGLLRLGGYSRKAHQALRRIAPIIVGGGDRL